MSVKTERVADMIQQELSYILQLEVRDSDIRFVTITDVHVTNDLSFAKVYVTVLREDKKEETLQALKEASGFLRKELAKRVNIRHIPELQFVYDESIDYGKHIEDLIDQIHKKGE